MMATVVPRPLVRCRPDHVVPMDPVRVDALVHELGTTDGHRLVLLSVEVYDEVADLRFARIDVDGATPLARRVPAADAWAIAIDGRRATVVDAVGRGDRAFSNGEVRFRPPPPPGATLQVRTSLTPGGPPLHATVDLPGGPESTDTTTAPR